MTHSTEIKITKTQTSRLSQIDFDNLPFGKIFSDHMFIADYENGQWKNARIIPYQNISISPANATLHYAQSIFEGLKAHRNNQGDILVFRMDANARRMSKSAERMCMPSISEDFFINAIDTLISIDHQWVPKAETKGASLYIRPFMFANDPFIGIAPSKTYRFMVICSPSGSYYQRPVKVKIEKQFTRAVKGGVGASKTSGNYAASLYPAKLALAQGYDQLIWTDGQKHEFIEEAGTMNLMLVINDIIVTPPISDSILAGITRDSALILAKDMGLMIEERPIRVDEIIHAIKNNTLQEAFGIGTAATISHIQTIGYEGIDYELTPISQRTVANQLEKILTQIKYGEVKDKFGWIHKVDKSQ